MLLWELDKLYLRVKLLYIYFMCDLINNKDSPPPSSFKYRRFTAITTTATDRAACIKEDKEEDIIISIAYKYGAGYSAAYGARQAIIDTIDCGAYKAYRAIVAPGDAIACLATVDGLNGADSAASLGYNKRVKRPADKARIIRD